MCDVKGDTMVRVLFVCLGNICRSPMAEFVLKDMVSKRGLQDEFLIESAATSDEEVGNPVHYGTRKKLESVGIYVDGKYSRQLKKEDYEKYDYILGMEEYNIKNILKIVGDDRQGKVCRLLDFSDKPRDIADPWYTHNFDVTYNDIVEGCNAFLQRLV